jgi:hypothetical protein
MDMRLATTKSDGLYITCVYCQEEEFILNPEANKIDQRDYTCSSECKAQYFIILEHELDDHDEYCDLCNPDIARYEEEIEQINQIHNDKYNETMD